MKQPLWAINGSLLLLCILSQLAFLFIYTPIARRASIEPNIIAATKNSNQIVVDIKKIYGVNDLFNTYAPAILKIDNATADIPSMPEAPALIPLSIPVEHQKTFIPPLPVTLKGVVFSQTRPEQSIAIVQFQNSKDEINYHVGQLIQDAQILKIYPNRIIIVRSNGQRETLFLRENEAKKDLAGQSAREISTLTIPIKSGAYQVPIDLFTMHVKTLGNFIDLLDLTTVYKKGKSVGCRVAKAEKDSLAVKLGLQAEDIIIQIDDLPITDIASRVIAFNNITSKKSGSTITTIIERENHRLTLKYELITSLTNQEPLITKETNATNQESLYTIEEHKKHVLEQKIKLAPTANQIEIEERKKMMQARQQPLIAKNTHAKG